MNCSGPIQIRCTDSREPDIPPATLGLSTVARMALLGLALGSTRSALGAVSLWPVTMAASLSRFASTEFVMLRISKPMVAPGGSAAGGMVALNTPGSLTVTLVVSEPATTARVVQGECDRHGRAKSAQFEEWGSRHS